MSDYQVMCVCVTFVVIVIIVAATFVLRNYVIYLSNRAISRNEYYCLYIRVAKIERRLRKYMGAKAIIFTSEEWEKMKRELNDIDEL